MVSKTFQDPDKNVTLVLDPSQVSCPRSGQAALLDADHFCVVSCCQNKLRYTQSYIILIFNKNETKSEEKIKRHVDSSSEKLNFPY